MSTSRAEIMEEMTRVAVGDIRAALDGPLQTTDQLGAAVYRTYESYLGAAENAGLDDPTVLRALAAMRHALVQAADIVGADLGLIAIDLGDKFVIAEREDSAGQTLQ